MGKGLLYLRNEGLGINYYWNYRPPNTQPFGQTDQGIELCSEYLSVWWSTLWCVRGKKYSQIHCTDKYSEHCSIIWSVWPNGWVFVYELRGSGFESSCNRLNFRFCACFEQGVLWYSGNYWVWIHSEMRKWHDKNIQLKETSLQIFTQQIF